MSTLTTDNSIIQALKMFTARHNGALFELRIISHKGRLPAAGFFDQEHIEEAAEGIVKYNGKSDIYITLNPVDPSEIAKRHENGINKINDPAGTGTLTGKRDILRREWLLIDVDPERDVPPDKKKIVSSTEQEKKKAFVKAQAVRQYLIDEGWNLPVFADSGNGYHLLYRVALPNNDAVTELIGSFLVSLSGKFSDDEVKLDTAVKDPPRIVKLYGTIATKGDNTPERPHRKSAILETPGEIITIQDLMIRRIAGYPPLSADKIESYGSVPGGSFDVRKWCSEHSIVIGPEKPDPYNNRTILVLKTCPFDPAHKKANSPWSDAAIFEYSSGMIGFSCFHNGCQGNKWRDLREKFEPGYQDKRNREQQEWDNKAGQSPSVKPVEIIEVKPLHERLQEKLERDRQRKPGELLGYRMKDLGVIAEKCDGIQPGFYILGAYTNIGKTALLVNMFQDLLTANPETTGIYFSLDDNEDIIINRFLARMAGLPINACQKPRDQTSDKEILIDNVYAELIDMSKNGRLFLYDIGSVNHINGFRNIVMEHSDKKLIIAIDGLYNLQVGDGIGYGGIREENIERANQVKALVDLHKIPVLTTAEVRKPSGKSPDRPTLHDLMESSKFAYNANLVWILHPPALSKEEKSVFKDEVEKFNQEREPVINLWFEKNKMSEFKGCIELQFTKKTGTMDLVKKAATRFDC